MSNHDWKQAWAECATPEEHRALCGRIKFIAAEKAIAQLAVDVAGKAQLEAKTCELCVEPLPSLRRKLCPQCRRHYRRS